MDVLMSILDLIRSRTPDPEPEELVACPTCGAEVDVDEPAFLRKWVDRAVDHNEFQWRSGVRGVHVTPRPLEWSSQPTNNGYYYARFRGEAALTIVLVEDGYYRWKPSIRPTPVEDSGLQFAGPLPMPTEGGRK
jgi:hypothetical protein